MWSYNEQTNRLEHVRRPLHNCCWHHKEGRANDKNSKHLRSESKGDRRETSGETELAINKQARGRRHGARGRLGRPQPKLRTEVHRVQGSRILGTKYWREWAGIWKLWPIHSLLDAERKLGIIHHRLDLGQPTVWKLDDFGWESCQGVWSRDHRMGGGQGEAGGSRRHNGCTVDPGSHIAGGQGVGWETLERAGKGKGILWSGEHRQRLRERSRVVPGSTG